MPVPGTVIRAPKVKARLWMRLTARPSASTATIEVVSPPTGTGDGAVTGRSPVSRRARAADSADGTSSPRQWSLSAPQPEERSANATWAAHAIRWTASADSHGSSERTPSQRPTCWATIQPGVGGGVRWTVAPR